MGMPDPMVQTLLFIDESLLFSTLSNGDIRVFYTKGFHPMVYEEPPPDALISHFHAHDSRRKVGIADTNLTKEQQLVELQRRSYLGDVGLQNSMYGQCCSQTVRVCNGRVVLMGLDGVYKMQQLSWQDSLAKLES